MALTTVPSPAAPDRPSQDSPPPQARALIEQAERTQMADPKSALDIYRKALEALSAIPDPVLTARTLLGLAIANDLLGADADALDFGRRAIELAKTFKAADRQYLAQAYAHYGVALSRRGDYRKAIESYRQALDVAVQLKDTRIEAMARVNVGQALAKIGDFSASIDQILQSFSLFENLSDPRGAARALLALGDIQTAVGRPEDALDAYRKAFDLAVAAGDKRRQAVLVGNIGRAYLRMGRPTEAMESMNDAAARFRELDAQREYSDLLVDIGSLSRDQGDYRLALGYLADALAIKSRIGGADEIARAELVTASVLRLSKDLASAWARARRAADLVRRSDDRPLRRDVYEELAITAEARNDIAEALRYRKEFQALQAALFTEESRRKINELQARYETDAKDKEIALLRRQADAQQREIRRGTALRWLILALLGMTAAIAVLLFNRIRFRARAHRNLEQAHEETHRAYKALADAVDSLERTVRLDNLTGIANRKDMLERIEVEVQRFERYGKPFAVLIADVDNFKMINDRNGHEGGDYILQSVSATIRDALRKLDSVARWGGDEFLILLPETDLEGGRTVAEKIRWSVAESLYEYQGRTLPVTLTLGVGVYDRTGDINDVLRRADEALYEGKAAGRDRVVATSANAV